MKADFDVQNGTFLLYPTRRDVWRRNAAPIAQTVLELSAAISVFEPVVLGVPPSLDWKEIGCDSVGVQLKQMEYDDIWVRDSGAVPCDDGLVNFGFNAWGGEEGLISDWSLDETVPEQMQKIIGGEMRCSPLTLEGGNLLSNGRGTLVAIRATICNPNRNPEFNEAEIEELLKQALGVRKIIWIDRGLLYDETGGHIDNLCAFADEKTLLLAWTDDRNNPQYDIVREAFCTLESARGANGERFDIIKVPLPGCFCRTEEDCEGILTLEGTKERLVGEIIQPSYINFAFVNGGIILPAFNDDADLVAAEIFKSVFPDRRVISFPAREILLGGGGIHCITKNY